MFGLSVAANGSIFICPYQSPLSRTWRLDWGKRTSPLLPSFPDFSGGVKCARDGPGPWGSRRANDQALDRAFFVYAGVGQSPRPANCPCPRGSPTSTADRRPPGNHCAMPRRHRGSWGLMLRRGTEMVTVEYARSFQTNSRNCGCECHEIWSKFRPSREWCVRWAIFFAILKSRIVIWNIFWLNSWASIAST